MSRELAKAQSREVVLEVAAHQLRDVFDAEVAILLPNAKDGLEPVVANAETFTATEKDLSVAQWVWTHQKPAGAGTDTLPSTRATFLPLRGSRRRAGVLAIVPADAARLRDPDDRQLSR